jgi:hypothetical protein
MKQPPFFSEDISARIGMVLGAGASRAVSYADEAAVLSPLEIGEACSKSSQSKRPLANGPVVSGCFSFGQSKMASKPASASSR